MAQQTVTVTGLQEALDSLTVFQKARVPGSIAWSLNQFAVSLRKSEQERIQSTFNKSNAFTRNAPLFKQATKDNPRMLFFLRDNAPGGNSPDRYLYPQVAGGEVYITRFTRALRRSEAIGPGQYVGHWSNPKYKPTPGFISALVAALARQAGPVRSGRQFARNKKAETDYFIKRRDGVGTAIFKRKGKRSIDFVYGILREPPSVPAKYDWTEKRMAAIAEEQIPILLFGKLAEFI